MVPRLLVVSALSLLLAVGMFAPNVTGHGSHDAPPVVRIEEDAPNGPWGFSPINLTVEVGTKLAWLDETGVYHTITSTKSLDNMKPDGRFDGEVHDVGDNFTFEFKKPGTYNYYCKPHATFMYGTITVVGDAPTDTADSPGPGLVVLLGALLGVVLWMRSRK